MLIMAKPRNLICIVDDDLSVGRALERVVCTFGFEAKVFESSRQCLNGAHIDRAACLIADISMPNLDGFELHALLRAQGNNVPTIFISALDPEEYKPGIQSTDCIAFLSKPCDIQLLHGAINKAVTKK